jgi:hypothetical protein
MEWLIALILVTIVPIGMIFWRIPQTTPRTTESADQVA